MRCRHPQQDRRDPHSQGRRRTEVPSLANLTKEQDRYMPYAFLFPMNQLLVLYVTLQANPTSAEVQGHASAERGPTGPHPDAPTAGSMGYSHRTTAGTGTGLSGKVESVIGSMVGSHGLKARGLEKERDAKLAEAERLESQRKGLQFLIKPVDAGD